MPGKLQQAYPLTPCFSSCQLTSLQCCLYLFILLLKNQYGSLCLSDRGHKYLSPALKAFCNLHGLCPFNLMGHYAPTRNFYPQGVVLSLLWNQGPHYAFISFFKLCRVFFFSGISTLFLVFCALCLVSAFPNYFIILLFYHLLPFSSPPLFFLLTSLLGITFSSNLSWLLFHLAPRQIILGTSLSCSFDLFCRFLGHWSSPFFPPCCAAKYFQATSPKWAC